ncbi:MAG: hypothetical protein AAFX76_12740, partial [Planctomycetota bacterium]
MKLGPMAVTRGGRGTAVLLCALLGVWCGSVVVAEPLTVARLACQLGVEVLPQESEAEGLLTALDVELLAAGRGVRLVERGEIEAVLGELTLGRLAGAPGFSAVALAGADFVLSPRLDFEADPDAADDRGVWTLTVDVIDPASADVMGRVVESPPGRLAAGPGERIDLKGLAQRVTAALNEAASQRRRTADWTRLGVLFFGNVTDGSSRLDGLGGALLEGFGEDSPERIRVLRFPRVADSRDEQLLGLSGLTDRGARWRDVVDWWVWGEYEEVDWEGKSKDEATVRVRATVWDGRSDPVEVVVEAVGERVDGLPSRLRDRVVAVVSDPARGEGEAVSATTVAERLVGRAETLARQNLGGNIGVDGVWLNRWRQSYRLYDLASFFAPADPRPALEYVLTRYREDMVTTTDGVAGQGYLDEPRPLWMQRRAAAWAGYVDRFGLVGGWPRQQRWGTGSLTDNRAGSNGVEGMYMYSATRVADALEGYGSLHWRREWPLTKPQVATLGGRWADESYRRFYRLLAESDAEPATLAGYLSGLPHRGREARAKRAVDDSVARFGPQERLVFLKKVRRFVERVGARLDDPAWAEGLLAEVPTPQPIRPRRVAVRDSAPPIRSEVKSDASSAPVTETIRFNRRYFFEPRHIEVSGESWLAAGSGQDLGKEGLPMGGFLFWRVPEDGDVPARQIAPALGVTSGVTGMARDGERVWMATAGDGIAWLRLHQGDWKRFGMASGLPHVSYADIAADPRG